MHMDIDHIKKEGPIYIPLRVRPHLAWVQMAPAPCYNALRSQS